MSSHTHTFGARILCLLALLGSTGLLACGEKKAEQQAPPAASEQPAGPAKKHGLTDEQAKQVIAKVGDTTITLGQFAERLASQSPYLRARYASPERRKEFLDNMVRFELLSLEAKKRGLDAEDEVVRVKQQMMVQQMMKELFDDGGVKLSDISDAEITAYYEQNQVEFNKPEQRRASHILFKDKAKAEGVLAKLKAAPDDMELFRKLAEQNTVDAETKDRFGDLRFFTKEPTPGEAGPPAPVRAAAFALAKSGDLSPSVVQSEQGFHVIKLTGERAALARTLEDARRLIQNRLWRKKREDAIEKFVSDLRAKGNVKENLDLLAQVKVDTSGAAVAGAEGKAKAEPKGPAVLKGVAPAQGAAKQAPAKSAP
jgi:parvulin-like peptidyl-prolyl isomerase